MRTVRTLSAMSSNIGACQIAVKQYFIFCCLAFYTAVLCVKASRTPARLRRVAGLELLNRKGRGYASFVEPPFCDCVSSHAKSGQSFSDKGLCCQFGPIRIPIGALVMQMTD